MGFKHAVPKESIPTVEILGVNIAAINMEWLLEFTSKHVKKLSGDYICVSNVHTTVMAFENEEYRSVQNGGIMAIPDGGPLSTVGKRRGAREMTRTTGPSYMGEVLRISVKHGWKHYFYGSTQETLVRLRTHLEQNYPGLQIVGMYSPPFRPMTAMEDSEIVEAINASSPDFIWIGLGAPKQEEWSAMHQGIVKGLMVGVGAAFDYYAGNIKRAPNWMQNCNLEWLYRLIQDPKRLFMRYLLTNSKFVWNAIVRGK
ncbi:MAG: WecB/TagA/CpsF family glycosyltransferase [Atopobiaceae bacterium]|nr:WecB/TagA/CpsF family glycosyltransferase [Atopobiaceae bacterium]